MHCKASFSASILEEAPSPYSRTHAITTQQEMDEGKYIFITARSQRDTSETEDTIFMERRAVFVELERKPASASVSTCLSWRGRKNQPVVEVRNGPADVLRDQQENSFYSHDRTQRMMEEVDYDGVECKTPVILSFDGLRLLCSEDAAALSAWSNLRLTMRIEWLGNAAQVSSSRRRRPTQ